MKRQRWKIFSFVLMSALRSVAIGQNATPGENWLDFTLLQESAGPHAPFGHGCAFTTEQFPKGTFVVLRCVKRSPKHELEFLGATAQGDHSPIATLEDNNATEFHRWNIEEGQMAWWVLPRKSQVTFAQAIYPPIKQIQKLDREYEITFYYGDVIRVHLERANPTPEGVADLLYNGPGFAEAEFQKLSGRKGKSLDEMTGDILVVRDEIVLESGKRAVRFQPHPGGRTMIAFTAEDEPRVLKKGTKFKVASVKRETGPKGSDVTVKLELPYGGTAVLDRIFCRSNEEIDQFQLFSLLDRWIGLGEE